MTERAGYGIRRDYKLLNWEQNEFPILCEKCMGESRYIRMLKKPLGAECKICTRPFSTFNWKPKSDVSRIRKTEICSTCAKINNCCQTCIYDLQYNLPIDVRNKLMGDKKVELLMSEGNRDIFAHLANENIDKLQLPYEEHEALMKAKLLEQGSKLAGKTTDVNLAQVTAVVVKPEPGENGQAKSQLNQGQKQVLKQFEQAKKVVGSANTLGSKWVGIKYVDQRDEDFIRAKIGTFFEDEELEMTFSDGKIKLHFSKYQFAVKFVKVFSDNFVVKGKKLTVYWLDTDGNEEEEEEVYGVLNDDLAPPLPPPSIDAPLQSNQKSVDDKITDDKNANNDVKVQ